MAFAASLSALRRASLAAAERGGHVLGLGAAFAAAFAAFSTAAFVLALCAFFSFAAAAFAAAGSRLVRWLCATASCRMGTGRRAAVATVEFDGPIAVIDPEASSSLVG